MGPNIIGLKTFSSKHDQIMKNSKIGLNSGHCASLEDSPRGGHKPFSFVPLPYSCVLDSI